ncbi:putative necrosis-inducing factor-domain-containing protein [Aspergillus taichungensis]|uniref:Putative necrosis-inducing factor-domain-containing protein n=1 Tax=Aspergillus taichungensis TaxID=482145 RepID=A0A2J5I923_9EURO|nr:putative necrosis-inducing factor-domain-containing protein [Aspergillus taichungensis]
MKTTHLTAFLSTFLLVSAKYRCNQYSYKNEASGGSPQTSDCKTLAENIAGSGDWTSSGASQRELAKHGSCAFGTEEADGEGSLLYYVGNEDIIDVINEMIKQFDPEGNGRLGGSGEFHCDVPAANGGKAAKIKWGIY